MSIFPCCRSCASRLDPLCAALVAGALLVATMPTLTANAKASSQVGLSEERVPDTREVTGQRQIAAAWYSHATDRYAHGALGDDIEAGALQVRLANGQRLAYVLDEGSVFEDIAPRLVDLDGDGTDEVVSIRAYAQGGAALSVFKVSQSTIEPWVEYPRIGLANRWLNPVGFGDFDGDGQLEVAHIQTPHIGGILILSRVHGNELKPFASRPGVSNHAYGATELRMSAVVDVDADGRDEIIVPDQARRNLVVARFAGGQLEFRTLSMDKPITALFLTGAGDVRVLTQHGQQLDFAPRVFKR